LPACAGASPALNLLYQLQLIFFAVYAVCAALDSSHLLPPPLILPKYNDRGRFLSSTIIVPVQHAGAFYEAKGRALAGVRGTEASAASGGRSEPEVQ
jgi:hypothetical protein